MQNAANYANIRIKVVYGESNANSWDWDWVKCDLMPRTLSYLSQLLKVYPVQEKLFFTRTCSSFWPSNGKCARIDTDAEETCGEYGAVDAADLGHINYYYDSSTGAKTEKAAGSGGYADADLVIYATAKTSGCSGSTLAYAGGCR